MKIIVQKFGGTSVATPEIRRQVVNRIINAKENGYSPVVVVSAMGRKGSPYATDTLINLIREVNKNFDTREMDLLMSCGEIISAVLLSQTLEGLGHDAIALTGAQAGIITDNNYGNAQILEVRPDNLLKYLGEGKIPVVTGFQGVCEAGDITTLGRGGSDTSAAALGAGLNAEVVDIYTDVEGVMTTDPKIVPEARTLDTVTYEEICEMAHQGAKIVHPRAVEIVMQKQIPMRVKSTATDAPGTLITRGNKGFDSYFSNLPKAKIITGISHVSNIVQFKLSTQDSISGDTELNVFKSLAQEGISIDLFNISPDTILFTVKNDAAEKTASILRELGFQPKMVYDCTKVSVIGAAMRGVPGIMASIIEAMNRVGVTILQTADSHTTISCLVREEDTEKAMRSLHEYFELGK